MRVGLQVSSMVAIAMIAYSVAESVKSRVAYQLRAGSSKWRPTPIAWLHRFRTKS